MFNIPKFKERSFLVYGLGLSGRSVVKFFKKKNIKKFKVWDDKYADLYKSYRSLNLNTTLKKVDFIVLSPGISLIRSKKLKKYKKKIITDIDLFYLFKDRPKSIVVTGTNGKSTTCKLIAHLFKKNKINYSLGGNIGNPVLGIKNFKKDYIIIEASSFQLSHSKFIHPDIALFLNISNDHLDWHGNMSHYLNSKLKIFHLQSKKNYAFAGKKIKKIFRKNNFLSKFISPEVDKYKKIKNKLKNDYLLSDINNENMSFVLALAKLLNISEKNFLRAMNSFQGLPHRFEIFYKKKNLTFVNDSKATSFAATKLSLSSLKNVYWILGGLPKKKDKIEISKFKKNITKCFLIGKNIDFFKRQIKGKIIYKVTKDLENTLIQIFKEIRNKKNKTNSILLSPAAASFDQFKNFEKRGEEFKRLCKIYARKYI